MLLLADDGSINFEDFRILRLGRAFRLVCFLWIRFSNINCVVAAEIEPIFFGNETGNRGHGGIVGCPSGAISDFRFRFRTQLIVVFLYAAVLRYSSPRFGRFQQCHLLHGARQMG